MTDLIALMSSLVDCKGKILVPGIYDTVQKLEEAEAKLYEPIDFDMVKYEDRKFLAKCVFIHFTVIAGRLPQRYRTREADSRPEGRCAHASLALPVPVAAWSENLKHATARHQVDACGTGTFVAGIEGAFDGEGAKTVIPRKVIGKFSIRLVPNMQPEAVERLVIDFLEKGHKNSGSPNPIKCVHYMYTFSRYDEAF